MSDSVAPYVGCKIEWEGLLVEQPFCQQLEKMGWEWLTGDTDGSSPSQQAQLCCNYRFLLKK